VLATKRQLKSAICAKTGLACHYQPMAESRTAAYLRLLDCHSATYATGKISHISLA